MKLNFVGIQPTENLDLEEHPLGGDIAKRWMIHANTYSMPATVMFCLNFLGRDWFAMGERLKDMSERLTFVRLVLTLYGVQQAGFLMSKKDAMRSIGVEHVATMKRYTDLAIESGLVELVPSELDGRMEFLAVSEEGRVLIEAELAKVRRTMDWAIASSVPDDPDMQKVIEELEEQGPVITVDPPKLDELAVVADAYGGAELLAPIGKEGKAPPRTPPKSFARYIAAYGETLRVDKENLAARLGRATKYRWLGELSEDEAESRQCHEAALKDVDWLVKNDKSHLAMRADLHRKLENWDRAIADIDELLKLYPDNKYPRITRAWAYAGKQDWKRALEDLNAVLGEDGGGPDDWLRLRGVVHVNLGNYEEALADFNVAYDHASKSAGIARSFVTNPDLAKYKGKAEAEKDAQQAEGYAENLRRLRDAVQELLAAKKRATKKGSTKKK